MLSYKELIKQNKAFADAHYVIKNFGNGERWQINDHSQDPSFKYPLMYVEDLSNSSSDGQYTYSFKVWFVTRIEAPSKDNGEILYAEYANAKSDMIQCAQDLVSFWVQDRNFPTMEIDKSVSIETFIDYDRDEFTGCSATINFIDAFDYNNCIIPMDGVPTPPEKVVTLTVNGDAFSTITCGTTYDLTVKDTDGLEVGSKIGTEWIVPAAGGDPVANSMNGVSLTDAVAGTTKTFVITYADLSAVTVTTTSDNATAFIGTVPDIPAASEVYYDRPYLTEDVSHYTYDDGWRVANGANTYHDAIPDNGLRQSILEANGRFDVLKYFNLWAHKFRFTGSLGGYQDELDGLFYDVDGNPSDFVTEFPSVSLDGITTSLVYDHLTGIVYCYNRILRGLNVSANLLAAQAASPTLGYTWYAPSIDEMRTLSTRKFANPKNLRYPFANVASYTHTGTIESSNPSVLGVGFQMGYGGVGIGVLLSSTSSAYSMDWIAIFGTGTIPQP